MLQITANHLVSALNFLLALSCREDLEELSTSVSLNKCCSEGRTLLLMA